jgi:hypothetical protein
MIKIVVERMPELWYNGGRPCPILPSSRACSTSLAQPHGLGHHAAVLRPGTEILAIDIRPGCGIIEPQQSRLSRRNRAQGKRKQQSAKTVALERGRLCRMALPKIGSAAAIADQERTDLAQVGRSFVLATTER